MRFFFFSSPNGSFNFHLLAFGLLAIFGIVLKYSELFGFASSRDREVHEQTEESRDHGGKGRDAQFELPTGSSTCREDKGEVSFCLTPTVHCERFISSASITINVQRGLTKASRDGNYSKDPQVRTSDHELRSRVLWESSDGNSRANDDEEVFPIVESRNDEEKGSDPSSRLREAEEGSSDAHSRREEALDGGATSKRLAEAGEYYKTSDTYQVAAVPHFSLLQETRGRRARRRRTPDESGHRGSQHQARRGGGSRQNQHCSNRTHGTSTEPDTVDTDFSFTHSNRASFRSAGGGEKEL